jgi:2-dehydropantoate 2-reductase
MKILIIGLGIVGAVHGWALSRAGVDVTHKLRPGKTSKFDSGLAMDILDQREGFPEHQQALYHPRITEDVSASDEYDLVMVPTKQYQAVAAIEGLKDRVPAADFLLFCANWQGPGEIDALLPRARYLWGYSVSSGGVKDDRLLVTIQPQVRMGELDGARTPRLEAIMDMFGEAGFKADLKPNIIQWLWVHQAIAAGMIGTGLMAGSLMALASDPEMLRFMVLAVREALDVVRQRGVDLADYPDPRPYLETPIEQTVAQWQETFKTEHGQRVIEAGHFQHNPEEMRSLFLDVYQTGIEIGVDMPHLRTIYEKIG